MQITENIGVRHDSKYHNEPILALQVHTLYVGERGDQRDGLRHDRSRTDLSNGFGIGRQLQGHVPVRECVGGPDCHHQTDFDRQGRGVPDIFKENRCYWNVVLDKRFNDRTLVGTTPLLIS